MEMELESELHTNPSLLRAVRDPTSDQAWAAFAARYEGPIRRWCRCLGLGGDAVDEMTQRVLVKLLDAMQSFDYDPRRRFRGWLRRVVENEVKAGWRTRRRRPGDHGRGDLDAWQMLRALPDPDEVGAAEACLAAEELLERDLLVHTACQRARGRVEGHTWRAFWMTTVEGGKGRDVADRLGMTLGAVYVAKCRVLDLIREEIKALRVAATDS